jgi:integrase
MAFADVSDGKAVITESKTGKLRIMQLPPQVVSAVRGHVLAHNLDPTDPLFFGRDRKVPVTRQHAHRVFREVGFQLGLDGIGTHSMRKTYAWNILLATKSFEVVRDTLRHAYMSTTFLYLIDGLTSILPQLGRQGIPLATIVTASN